MCVCCFFSWKIAQWKPLDIQVTCYVIYWCENPLAHCKQMPSSKSSSPKQHGDCWGGNRKERFRNWLLIITQWLNYPKSTTVLQLHLDWMGAQRRNLEGVTTVTGSVPVQRHFPDVHPFLSSPSKCPLPPVVIRPLFPLPPHPLARWNPRPRPPCTYPHLAV